MEVWRADLPNANAVAQDARRVASLPFTSGALHVVSDGAHAATIGCTGSVANGTCAAGIVRLADGKVWTIGAMDSRFLWAQVVAVGPSGAAVAERAVGPGPELSSLVAFSLAELDVIATRFPFTGQSSR
jgi:hypothetical protein